jgi:dipeptidase E
MGDHPEYLTALVGDDSRRMVVIANAIDDAPEDVRRAGVERECTALGELGFDAAELDLRNYFDDEQRLRRELAGVVLAWLRGGNVFMLHYAMRRSGADTVFPDLLASDAPVFAGYSAGPCVLSPSLRGLEAVDELRLSGASTGPNLSGRAWPFWTGRSFRTTARRVIPRQRRWA